MVGASGEMNASEAVLHGMDTSSQPVATAFAPKAGVSHR
jgi:hypothetical protein